MPWTVQSSPLLGIFTTVGKITGSYRTAISHTTTVDISCVLECSSESKLKACYWKQVRVKKQQKGHSGQDYSLGRPRSRGRMPSLVGDHGQVLWVLGWALTIISPQMVMLRKATKVHVSAQYFIACLSKPERTTVGPVLIKVLFVMSQHHERLHGSHFEWQQWFSVYITYMSHGQELLCCRVFQLLFQMLWANVLPFSNQSRVKAEMGGSCR